MSWDVQKAVADRRVGSPTKKAILMFFAARASDDGSGIWTAKQKMADQLEMNKRTVQRHIGEMIQSGLISEIGQRSCARGYTIEYRINLVALNELDLTDDTVSRVAHDHPTGGTRPPLGVAHDHPNNPLKISQEVTNTPLPPKNKIFEILCSVMTEESAEAFIDHRRHKRAKLTEKAACLIAKKLHGNPQADTIVERSIMNGWTGVFPESIPANERAHGSGKSRHDGAAIERARRAAQRASERHEREEAERQDRCRLDSGTYRNPSQPLLSTRQSG